jgi:predicted RNA-binding Zn ribbon-like protein
MTPHRFELAGGHPALDFLNTIQDWTVPVPVDYLGDFSDAVGFGRAAGLLTRGEARALDATSASAEVARLRELRGVLEQIFRRQVHGRAPARCDLDQLGLTLTRAARATRLQGGAGAPVRSHIALGAAGAAVLRLRIAQAAAALLTSPALDRVKACPACGWFFLDVSKNRSRRWCSMASCGASAKSRRYYRRKRGVDPARGSVSITDSAAWPVTPPLPALGSAASPYTSRPT